MFLKKRKVLYYVQPYFLDCCLEIIKELKNLVELHLIVEVSYQTKRSTIIQFENIGDSTKVEDLKNAINNDTYKKMIPYISGCHSVKYIFFKSKSAFSPVNLIEGIHIIKYIIDNKIDTIHFDGQSARLILLSPWFLNKRILITIHDPKSHSGENNWKTNFVRMVYTKLCSRILFYSVFAKNQYLQDAINSSKKLHTLKLKPYSFISNYVVGSEHQKKYILFFGRISYYKGIDILLESIRVVNQLYPNEIFLIAGNFENQDGILNEIKSSKNITIIDKHLDTQELATMILNSKFIVCPYRDATQSGVLMTSFAMRKSVVASNVGAFPEYIKHEHNGLLSEPNHIDFAKNIIYALENNRYEKYENNIMKDENDLIINKEILLEAYS